MKPIKIILKILPFLILSFYQINGQRSIAYVWNNQMLESIKKDFARPPVHARNLYHLSLVFYEVWTIFEKKSNHYILNDTSSFLDCRIKNFRCIGSKDSAIHKAISYGAYRIINQRFKNSPGYQTILADIDKLMKSFNYNILDNSLDFSNGNAAALGNAIANCIIQYGIKDGSNEENNYASKIYLPINDSMIPTLPGNPNLKHPNRWQPLWLSRNIDQNGNPIAALQKFQSPEWGNVIPFSLANPKNNFREGQIYPIYIDPGSFPLLDTSKITKESEEFKWNMELVLAWSSHLDPNDTTIIDISPNGLGNVKRLPNDVSELSQFYDFKRGGDGSTGYPSNPYTNLPYKKQMVKRGDYTRAIAQYWADGPETETPPGHWYSIFNKYVTDRIGTKKFAGKDIQISELEWDVKAYLCLGSALHDAAIAAWGIKGWYDGVRPISAIRYMAMKGQSSDPQKPAYHPAGLHLIDGLIELVTDNDPLRGDSLQNINKIKVKVWRGIPNIGDPLTSNAGVGWILAENWWPFQEKTFVSPPFAGYISGHSTFSRAAADILTYITGSNFFPEGYAEFKIYKDNVFLRTEAGPSQDLNLQWATFQDAANQSSLSRIWGGIHPPMDDIPGRKIGIEIAKKVFSKAKKLFYFDLDQDGFVSIDDCDDTNPKIFPGAKEYCDLIDNNCNGVIDDSIQNISYFADFDQDG
ncbi:MAG: hypothetical protein IPL98_09890, partial [Saprospiraceae bacterium]|nr:hypothetical protein [Saprospiraceae bacterium]